MVKKISKKKIAKKKPSGKKHLVEFKYKGSPDKYQRTITAKSRKDAIKKVKGLGWHRPITIVPKKK